MNIYKISQSALLFIPSAPKEVYKLSLFQPICLDLALDFVYTEHIVYKQNVFLPLVISLASYFISVCPQNFIHSFSSFPITDTLVIIEQNHLTFYSKMEPYIFKVISTFCHNCHLFQTLTRLSYSKFSINEGSSIFRRMFASFIF